MRTFSLGSEKKAEQEEEMIHIETDAFDTSGKRLKM